MICISPRFIRYSKHIQEFVFPHQTHLESVLWWDSYIHTYIYKLWHENCVMNFIIKVKRNTTLPGGLTGTGSSRWSGSPVSDLTGGVTPRFLNTGHRLEQVTPVEMISQWVIVHWQLFLILLSLSCSIFRYFLWRWFFFGQGRRWHTSRNRHPCSYNWWCPHLTQYVYFIYVSYHGHYLVIPSHIGAMLDPHFKTRKDTTPEFTERILDMDSVFEFELLTRWVPKELDAACSVVKDVSTVTTTNSSLTPPASRVSGGISMSSFLAHNK